MKSPMSQPSETERAEASEDPLLAYKEQTLRQFESGGTTQATPPRLTQTMSRESILTTLDQEVEERDTRENERLKNEIAVLEKQLDLRKSQNQALRDEVGVLLKDVEALVSENKAVQAHIPGK